MSKFDIFVSSTGNFNTTTLDHVKKLMNDACIGNSGTFVNEIDMLGSEGLEGTLTVQHDTNSTATVYVYVRSHCGFAHKCSGRVGRSVCPLAPRRPILGRLLDVPALSLLV